MEFCGKALRCATIINRKIHVRLYALGRGAGRILGCEASDNVSFKSSPGEKVCKKLPLN